MADKKSRIYTLISVLTITLFLVVWYIATDVLGLTSPSSLPSPLKIVKTFIGKFTNPNPDGATLLQHLAASLQVALSGYLIGLSVGIPLGIMMAWSEKFD